jgi:hypothetical protein
MKNYLNIVAVSLISVGLIFSACKKKDDNSTNDANVVKGCTNPEALNYNSSANSDDGTCQVATQTQKALVIEFTATWCSPCGSWGIPQFYDLIEYKPTQTIGMACHSSDDLSPVYVDNSFSAEWNITGIPSFIIGEQETTSTSAINSILAKTPPAQTVLSFTKSGNVLAVKSKTKFFTATSGEYYLAFYAIEDGIQGVGGLYDQSGNSDPNYKHNHVIRACSHSSNAFGEMIASGNIAAGKIVEKNFNLGAGGVAPLDWSKVYVVSVIWKKESGVYKFINAFEKR